MAWPLAKADQRDVQHRVENAVLERSFGKRLASPASLLPGSLSAGWSLRFGVAPCCRGGLYSCETHPAVLFVAVSCLYHFTCVLPNFCGNLDVSEEFTVNPCPSSSAALHCLVANSLHLLLLRRLVQPDRSVGLWNPPKSSSPGAWAASVLLLRSDHRQRWVTKR